MNEVTQSKLKVQQKSKLDKEVFKTLGMDTQVSLIQAFIPIGIMAVEELLYQEVEQLAGPRYHRKEKGDFRGHRWGTNPGSVHLGESKVGIQVPRVRDKETSEEVPLRSYRRFQSSRKIQETYLAKLMGGLSCRRYSECASLLPDVFGISSSSLSRRFMEVTEEKLKAFETRRLDGYDFVALFIDGKTFAGQNVIIVLGVTMDGRKVPIGFRQGATEHHQVCSDLLNDLIDRGLSTELGLLVVIDGSKGLFKAVKTILAEKALIQRCQWHKRENVVSYLPKERQSGFRKQLQAAYQCADYEEAREKLKGIREELQVFNRSAAKSLDEGLDETLTLHKLALMEELGQSFRTTNCIESLNSQIARLTGRVKHWQSSKQLHRWVASSLLDIETRMRKIKGYEFLWKLREAIQEELNIKPAEMAA